MLHTSGIFSKSAKPIAEKHFGPFTLNLPSESILTNLSCSTKPLTVS